MLEESKLGREFWGHAVLTAAHIHNRMPSRSHGDLSPLEHWTGSQPDIGHLRVFGSIAWVHIPNEKRRKLDSKSVRTIFIGYEEDPGSRVYQLYNLETKKLLLSRDVIIDERIGIEVEKGQNIGIGWSPETLEEPVQSSPTCTPEFQCLDPIAVDQGSSSMPPLDNIQDSITVRPQLASTTNATVIPVQASPSY